MRRIKLRAKLKYENSFCYTFVWVLSLSISKMAPRILKGVLPRCFSLGEDFSCWVWFRETFLFALGIISFFSLHLFYWDRFQYSQLFFNFPLLRAFWFFLDFGSFIPSVIYLFPILIMSKAHFSMPNSIPISLLYILIVCFRVSFYFLQTSWCLPCT